MVFNIRNRDFWVIEWVFWDDFIRRSTSKPYHGRSRLIDGCKWITSKWIPAVSQNEDNIVLKSRTDSVQRKLSHQHDHYAEILDPGLLKGENVNFCQILGILQLLLKFNLLQLLVKYCSSTEHFHFFYTIPHGAWRRNIQRSIKSAFDTENVATDMAFTSFVKYEEGR